jgi:dTDP-4-dehydrorhamnose 3,5-epimerase
MIHGVQAKPLRVFPDDRGFLMEMLRADEPIFEQFGQAYLTACRRGVAKAWHYHRQQTDHFVCVGGTALVVLYDGRDDSPTRGTVQDFTLHSPPSQDPAPLLLKIPPLVIHGFTAIRGEEARIINIPTLAYRHADPDEHRYPWNSQEIPYRWPPEIVRGG